MHNWVIVSCSWCRVTLAVSPFASSVTCHRCYQTTFLGGNQGQGNPFNQPGMQGHQLGHPNAGFPAGYPPVFGKKRALLVGINIVKMNGKVTDVFNVASLLTQKFGYPRESMVILTGDNYREPNKIPTKANMLTAMRWLVSGCTPGDSLVFYYTGHGTQVRDCNYDELDGKDEALCPVDYETNGFICDDQINEIIVRPLPYNVKLHAIFDTCYSGTALDLVYQCDIKWNTGSWQWQNQTVPGSVHYKGTSGGFAVLIGSCIDYQSTYFVPNKLGAMTGIMTNSFFTVIMPNPMITYGHLLNAINTEINRFNSALRLPRQDPQLSSSEAFNIYRKPFLL